MLLFAHGDYPQARYPYHNHVHILVYVLADAAAGGEPDQVRVKILALLQDPHCAALLARAEP